MVVVVVRVGVEVEHGYIKRGSGDASWSHPGKVTYNYGLQPCGRREDKLLATPVKDY